MITRALRYSGVAAGSALFDWIVFIALSVIGVHHITAIAFSRMAGGLFSFLANRKWTFGADGKRHITVQGRRFLLLYAVSYLLAISMVFVLVDVAGFAIYVTKLGADATCFLFNFVVMKVYVYHERLGIFERLHTGLRRSG